MTISGDCPQGRSQHFTFPRRGLLQGLAVVGLPFLLPRSKSAFEIPSKYPAPKFSVGDQIFSLGTDEYGDIDESAPLEFGEIVGVCWHPRNKEWEYIINWTAGSSSAWIYPVFDGVLIDEYSLRLVSHD